MGNTAAAPPAITRPLARLAGRHVGVIVALILLICLTRPFTLADTGRYVNEIVLYYGRSPLGAKSLILEFGHPIWRPLGWLLLQASAPIIGPWFGGNVSDLCTAILILMNVIAGFCTVLTWHSLALRVMESRAAAFAVALAFACANAFLAHMRSGSTYVVGLLFVSMSVWIVYGAEPRKAITAAGAGLALAAATLLWLPYVLSVPAVLFIGLRLDNGRRLGWANRENMLFAARLLGTCSIIVTLWFVFAVRGREINSLAEAKAWVKASGNGWSQNNRPIRIVTGLPRSFLYFGEDGILYKRFLWKDPYNPVTVSRLVRASLWKLAFFYLFVAALALELIRRPGNRCALVMLLIGAVPVVAFAIFVFEPGSPERYLPAYPFLVLAVALALRDYPRSRRPLQHVIVIFLVGLVATNVYSTFRPSLDQEDAVAAARALPLKQRLPDHYLVSVLNNQDGLWLFLSRSPFHPLNQPKAFQLYDVIEPGVDVVARWREEFAQRALLAWRDGGEVWVSKRLWADRPLAEWQWVEGDDPRVTWREIPAFFDKLQISRDEGGDDGFYQLDPGGSNVITLTALAGNKSVPAALAR